MGSSSNPNSSSFNFPDHKIYSEQTSAYNEGHHMGSRGSTSSSSSASSSRRGQSQGQQQQQQQPMGKCQVEGCGVDLSGAKPYYCKHRVCGPHSKSPRVIVGGLDQRFCQQCSRFHIISEFDQGKRSCRRRLAGHNERRRKPTAGPLLTHPRHFLPFFHDDGNRSRGFIMDFTRPRTTVEFGSSNSSHNVAVVNSNPHDFPQAPTSRPFFPSSNEILAGIPSSSCALSLLSSPVQWSGATGTDSFQNPVGFRGSHEASTITTSVHTVHQNIGPGIMGRPDQTSQFSGELESALHGNRQSIIGDDSRSYGHSDAGDDGHDVIHWSL